MSSLSSAAIEVGRLDGAVEAFPDPDQFVYSYVRKEAVLSSQIEGSQSTLIDLLDFEAGVERASCSPDVLEVANYVRALTTALERVRNGEPLSIRLLKDTHRILFDRAGVTDFVPGELRDRQNWIGPLGSSPATADFVPPPPEAVEAALTALVDYLASKARVPTLLQGALAHSQFETVHPFPDGNGRMGRILVTLLLSKTGTLRRPLLYLSDFFLKNREEYRRRLQRVTDSGDWEGWVAFFLEGVRTTALQAAETARATLALRVEHESLVTGELGKRSGAGYRLLATLFAQPVVSVKDIAVRIGTTYPPANALADRFVDFGLFVEITGHRRNRFFRYQPYIDCLLRDRTPATSTHDSWSSRS